MIERRLRRRSLKWVLRARAVDRARRPDPDFIVVGAQKAGSTSLFAYLAAHPGVAQPLVKEINFFDLWPGRGHDWYRRHFPRIAGSDRKTGEASPMYMVHPYAMERIAQDLPEVRIVVILREPVERLLSHYRHSVKLAHEDQSLDDALALEEERIKPDLQALEADRFHSAYAFQKFTYLRRSLYYDQVDKILKLFPGRCLFLRLEDLGSAESMRPLCEFLGLPFEASLEFEAHNVNLRTARPEIELISPEILQRIRTDADRTCDLLGWDRWPA